MNSRSEGNQFEALFERECQRSLIGIQRIKNTGWARGGFVSVKAPFDFILAFHGKTAAIDTKTYDCSNLTHSLLEAHQLDALRNLWEHGVTAGYVVHFRKANKVVFFSVPTLFKIEEDESLKPEDGEYLGPIESMNLRQLFNGESATLRTPIAISG